MAFSTCPNLPRHQFQLNYIVSNGKKKSSSRQRRGPSHSNRRIALIARSLQYIMRIKYQESSKIREMGMATSLQCLPLKQVQSRHIPDKFCNDTIGNIFIQNIIRYHQHSMMGNIPMKPARQNLIRMESTKKSAQKPQQNSHRKIQKLRSNKEKSGSWKLFGMNKLKTLSRLQIH